MIFILIVYAAPGACRKAAKFLARPFASAGGGYSKRQIYLSFTIAWIHANTRGYSILAYPKLSIPLDFVTLPGYHKYGLSAKESIVVNSSF